MKHIARKRFGQNFLTDNFIISEIIDSLNLQPTDKFLEIGPGLGAITNPLLKYLNHLTAIEIDRDLQLHLSKIENSSKLELISMDALKVDYSSFGDNLRIVGNLPYNISTPLLIHLIDYSSRIKDMHFMLQKEVVARLAAVPGSKAYGRLSVITQYFCEVEYLFDVPPGAFSPAPKVDSAFIRLTPHTSSPYPEVNLDKFKFVIKQAFSMRRKTIYNNLKNLLKAKDLIYLEIDPQLRPENLSIKEYLKIVEFLSI